MMIIRRELPKNQINEYLRDTKFKMIACEYAKEGFPGNGIAYYRYMVFKLKNPELWNYSLYFGSLIVIECTPRLCAFSHKVEMNYTLCLIDY